MPVVSKTFYSYSTPSPNALVLTLRRVLPPPILLSLLLVRRHMQDSHNPPPAPPRDGPIESPAVSESRLKFWPVLPKPAAYIEDNSRLTFYCACILYSSIAFILTAISCFLLKKKGKNTNGTFTRDSHHHWLDPPPISLVQPWSCWVTAGVCRLCKIHTHTHTHSRE